MLEVAVASGADSMEHGGTCPPTFTNGWARGTVSRRTANNKLTKLYWPRRKRSPKRQIVLLEPKSGGGTTKKIFPAFYAGSPDRAPTFALDRCSHFQIRSGASGCRPLST